MLGKPVPEFSVTSTGGSTPRLANERGQTLVLYFYPKDNTPGCTTEGAELRDRHSEFAKAKIKLPVALLADGTEPRAGSSA